MLFERIKAIPIVNKLARDLPEILKAPLEPAECCVEATNVIIIKEQSFGTRFSTLLYSNFSWTTMSKGKAQTGL